MAEVIYGNQDRSSLIVLQVPIAISASTTSGQIAAIELAGAAGTWVHRAWINRTTASAAACTLDIGIAANATTSSDVLLDGISINATGVADSADGTDNGTNGVVKPQLATGGQFVTATVASGNANGFVGTLHILVSGDL
jgi:hypothetical protein